LMRAIDRYAYLLWEDGQTEDALEIFRHLLRANPGDNQGARHSILAILMGMGADWEDMFMITTGPAAGMGLDARQLGDWFDTNAKKFPDEFDWLFAEWKKFDIDNLEEDLRTGEQMNILCGQKHFEAIGTNFAVATKRDLSDLNK
ncbi:MAG: hypothetical protein COY02_00805, partial [Parcubacteria group bacterium CG_4_10_14_0_2_um_filter_41_6]